MARSRAGTSMPRAEEKSVRPPISISPASTRRSPATASNKVVLPAPDGPIIAAARHSNATSSSSVTVESGMRHRSSMASRLNCRPGEALGKRDGDKSQGDRHAEQSQRLVVVAQLNEAENSVRERLRSPRNVAGDHNRRAELAQRAGVSEQTAGDDAAPREGQRHGEKDFRTRCAERRGDLLQPRVYLGKSATRRAHEQRKRHDRHRDQHAFPFNPPPRAARGSVTAKKIFGPDAPSVAAICSSRGFTSAKALRAERTSNGKDMRSE